MRKILYLIIVTFMLVGCNSDSTHKIEATDTKSQELEAPELDYNATRDTIKELYYKELNQKLKLEITNSAIYDINDLNLSDDVWNKIMDDGEEGDVLPLAFVSKEDNESFIAQKKHNGDFSIYYITKLNDTWDLSHVEFLKNGAVITENQIVELTLTKMRN
ncbi:hypothetical protein [Bacillus sp. CGMCC 1.16541]|uniref:hypothetical protein n=1 Tax=Bacillus sp. CGMCC 1.16541 TaxID=2185143 RepID=UPI000D73D74E|nr:hypothetical protein [Bacillus sp. CGMCC 1.16541]